MKCSMATIMVLANDSDPEGNTPLYVLGVTQGTKGTVSVRGGTYLRYIPNGQTGTDLLTYTVRDSLGASSTGTVAVTVEIGQCI